MEINAAIEILNDLKKNSIEEKNIKYSEKFLRVLNELKLKNYDENLLNKINNELSIIFKNFEIQKLNINVKDELRTFLKFLKSEFSIIVPNYNFYIGITIGAVFSVFLGIISMLAGIAICGLIGYLLDRKAEKEGRYLKTELDSFIC